MALPDLEMFEKSLLQGVQVGDTAMTEPDLEAVNILRDLGKIDQDQRRRSFDVAPRGSYRDRFSSFGSLGLLLLPPCVFRHFLIQSHLGLFAADTLSEVALASANLVRSPFIETGSPPQTYALVSYLKTCRTGTSQGATPVPLEKR